MSGLQDNRLPWKNFNLLSFIFYSIILFTLTLVIEMKLSFKKELSDKICSDLPNHLIRTEDQPIPEGYPIFKCKAVTSNEVIDNVLRRNWEVTIRDLWNDNREIIEKLTSNHLSALRMKEEGFFNKEVTRFITNGKVGFIFVNPECDIKHYALWAKVFELSASKSLFTTNILLPSELFSARNKENSIRHAVTFKSNSDINKIRIQIFTNEKSENNKIRNEDTFNAEIEESELSSDELIQLYAIIADDNCNKINEKITTFENKTRKNIKYGDYYKAFFKELNTQNMKWGSEQKEDLGSRYFGDYVVIDYEIVLRYTKNYQTLELLCGEIVEKFNESFEPFLA